MRNNYLKKYMLLCALLLTSCLAFAQTTSITGKVLDENNEALPGASVTIVGSTLGAATNGDGVFTITGVKPGKYTVEVKFIGYTGVQTAVTVTTGSTQLNFSLKPDSKGLNEVVVIGYGTVKKKDLTGAITVVSAKDFQQGQVTSPQDLIAGKIAGVTVTSNGGSPGGGSTVRIRAGASLAASNDPLYIIDGVPIQSAAIPGSGDPLSTINPNDIESFTVLKDAAATAIYGSRASNGVIIVTTKQGAVGPPKINFSTSYSVGNKTKDISVLSADQLRSVLAAYDAANGTDKSALLGNANTNWQNEIYQQAQTSDNNLSISGATKHMPYRVSVGYLDQTGILKTSDLKRATAGVSLTPSFFNDDLKVSINAKGTTEDSRFANTGAIGAAVQFDPTQPVKVAGSPWDGYYEWYNTPNVPSSGINPNTPRNPVGMLEDNHNTATIYRSLGNIQFDYRFPFIPGLHANLNLAYDLAKGNGVTYVPANAAQSYATPGGGANNPYGGNYTNTVGEFYLSYIKDLKAIKSNINATAGYGYYDDRSTTFNYYSYNAAKDTVAGTKPAFPYSKYQNTLISYYARLIYTYDAKYILQGSIRTDGSSRFAPDVRWGVFPEGSFTWKIKEEDFLIDSHTLSNLNLRVSYGITGNQEGIADYSYLPTYALGASAGLYQFGNTFYNTYTPSAYNLNLKWEQTATTNIGVDYGFLNNRINGSIDAYIKKTKNLLATVETPPGANFSNQLLSNVGNVEDQGIEFSISAVPVKTDKFTWNVAFNATFQKSKLTNLTLVPTPGFTGEYPTVGGTINGGYGAYAQYLPVGYTPYSFYLYKQVYGSNGAPLEGVYKSTNGVNPDLNVEHSPYPTAIYGFSTSFIYKKWTLSTVLRANLGNYMYNNIDANFGNLVNIIPAGGDINNATSSYLKTKFAGANILSDYYLQNASFLKMDNVGVSYNVGHIFHDPHINLQLNANCQNVFTVTNYTGIDPESSNGIDYNFYPRPRTFTVGINLGL
jgi:TonB-linked SusC/RagA family outer membrane protein